MRILGCDPGCYGAIALLVDGQLETTWQMPFVKVRRGKTDKAEIHATALHDLLLETKADHLFIEQVGGITGQSASAAFNFGRAAGAPEYMAAACGMAVTRVPPGNWKRDLQVFGKTAAVNRASQLFPAKAQDWSAWRGNGSADQREGRAEAALIAYYGWRQLGGSPAEEHENVFD